MDAGLELTVLLYVRDAGFPKLKMFMNNTPSPAFQGSEVSNHNPCGHASLFSRRKAMQDMHTCTHVSACFPFFTKNFS